MGREHYTSENKAASASAAGLRASRWVAPEDSEGWMW